MLQTEILERQRLLLKQVDELAKKINRENISDNIIRKKQRKNTSNI